MKKEDVLRQVEWVDEVPALDKTKNSKYLTFLRAVLKSNQVAKFSFTTFKHANIFHSGIHSAAKREFPGKIAVNMRGFDVYVSKIKSRDCGDEE